MSETIALVDRDIEQGATYAPPQLTRAFSTVPISAIGPNLVDPTSGNIVDISSLPQEDYTGCTAVMNLRVGDATGTLVHTLSTVNGEIILNGASILRRIPASVTATFPVGILFGQIDITRPDSSVERQYEITCNVKPNGN